jgi:hypothetical protein
MAQPVPVPSTTSSSTTSSFASIPTTASTLPSPATSTLLQSTNLPTTSLSSQSSQLPLVSLCVFSSMTNCSNYVAFKSANYAANCNPAPVNTCFPSTSPGLYLKIMSMTSGQYLLQASFVSSCIVPALSVQSVENECVAFSVCILQSAFIKYLLHRKISSFLFIIDANGRY